MIRVVSPLISRDIVRVCRVSNPPPLTVVMYIPAVPTTKMNLEYVKRQKECFLSKERPPDFPKGKNEKDWVGTGSFEDMLSDAGKVAMGFN